MGSSSSSTFDSSDEENSGRVYDVIADQQRKPNNMASAGSICDELSSTASTSPSIPDRLSPYGRPVSTANDLYHNYSYYDNYHSSTMLNYEQIKNWNLAVRRLKSWGVRMRNVLWLAARRREDLRCSQGLEMRSHWSLSRPRNRREWWARW